MKKLTVVIVDDDPNALELLENYLVKTNQVEVIEKLNDPLELDHTLIKTNPDALFLDINMPNCNGLKLLENIRKYNKNIPVVFVSGFDKFGISALKLQAFDYLLKPIKKHELTNTVKSLIDFTKNKKCEIGKYKLPIQDGFIYLKNEDVLYLKANGNYTNIFLSSGESFVSSYNLGRLVEMLPNGNFLRINRRIFVNSNFLHRVNKKNKTCILKYLNVRY